MIIEKILETMVDGYVLVDIEGRILSVNSSYCTMSGYSKEELLKLSVPDIEFIDDYTKVKERIEKVIKQGFDRFESIHKRKDGLTYPVEVSINSIFENNEYYISGIFRDITEKKQMDEKLKTSEKIFNHSLDMLCISGFDGFFKVLNPAWEKTLGWSNEELLQKPWIEFVYPEDRSATKNIKSVIVDGKEIYQFENRYICKNGEIKWLSWNAFPYPEENIMFGVARDITEKKKSEEILHRSEENYRLQFMNMSSYNSLYEVLTDNNGKPFDFRFLMVNAAYENYVGKKAFEVVGKTLLEVFPQTEQYWIDIISEAAISGQPIHYENYSVEMDIYTDIDLYTPQKGQIAMITANMNKRKEAEMNLRKSEAIKDKMVSNIGDVIVIIDKDGINKYKSSNITRLFGWSLEDVVGKNTFEYVYPEDIPSAQFFLEELAKSPGASGTTQLRYKRKDGTFVWIEITVVNLLNDRHINGFLGNYHDITERKLIEAELISSKKAAEENEEKFRAYTEQSPVAIYLTDLNGDCTYANEKWLEFAGMTFDEAMGKGWINALFEEDRNIISENWYNSAKSNGKWAFEYRFINKKGEITWVEGTAKELINNRGELAGYLGVNVNITDRKNAEKELILAKNIAEKANRAKSEFLSNMSHEIRTPMNGMFGFIDILYEIEKDVEKREYLEAVKECSKHLLDIVNDILSLSKIESGKYTLAENTVNIFCIIEKIARIFKEQAKAKGLDFMFEIDNNLKKEIKIDEKSLLQILNNLLSNAIKFTQRGFVLLIVTEILENELEIRVKDTGIGINKEKQKRLFDQFDQGEHYLTKNYGGTGLGLSIVKKLVDMQKGEIVVETEEGKGTQITTIIPFKVSESSIKENETEKLESLKIENKIRVISAEDVEINQMLLEKIFKYQGWEFTKAYNGKELIEKIQKEDYDIILMDIQMPEMNGFEATKAIRSNREYDGIPIIGVSAYALEEDIKKALILGMNDYIAKPLKKEELIEKISKWVKK